MAALPKIDTIDRFVRGEVNLRQGRIVSSHRNPRAEVLGSLEYFKLDFDHAKYAPIYEEHFSDELMRHFVGYEAACIRALSPKPSARFLEDRVSVASSFASFLDQFVEKGFRARCFDQVGHYFPVYDGVSRRVIKNIQSSLIPRKAVRVINRARRQVRIFSDYPAIDVDPAFDDKFYLTEATHIAARLNCPNIINHLLRHLPDTPAARNEQLHKQDKLTRGKLSGLTAIHHGAVALAKDAVLMLLERGVEYAVLDKKDNTFMHALAVSTGKSEDQLACFHAVNKWLQENIADPLELKAFYQAKNKDGKTALKLAAEANNKELVTQLLFVTGADVETVETNFKALSIHYGRLLGERIVQVERDIAGVKKSILELQSQIHENTAAKVELRSSVRDLTRLVHWQHKIITVMAMSLSAAGMMPQEAIALMGEVAQPCPALLAWEGEGVGPVAEVPHL